GRQRTALAFRPTTTRSKTAFGPAPASVNGFGTWSGDARVTNPGDAGPKQPLSRGRLGPPFLFHLTSECRVESRGLPIWDLRSRGWSLRLLADRARTGTTREYFDRLDIHHLEKAVSAQLPPHAAVLDAAERHPRVRLHDPVH